MTTETAACKISKESSAKEKFDASRKARDSKYNELFSTQLEPLERARVALAFVEKENFAILSDILALK